MSFTDISAHYHPDSPQRSYLDPPALKKCRILDIIPIGLIKRVFHIWH